MKGAFIVFEGPDGAGLSTQAELLDKYLRKKGYKVVLTKEPTIGLIGGLIKAALKNEWKTSPLAMQLLFTADRAHHIDMEILPAIDKGKIVISDRYFFSTFAYGEASGLDVEWLKKLNSKFPMPDLTIFIDVPVDVSIERIKTSRFEMELFEEKEKLEKIRKAYLKIAEIYNSDKTVVIDGTKSVEEIHAKIVKIVADKLKI
ncbi:MAG: dTMP kinase [Candidatus Parvarchaeota archaeon]|nr:dTMP kinase [Candidatus Jingweiarchaeum tengchongense]MCW1300059.1 dTMP kinase [Candidatus Jingweiarchaeum tengchongense]MCW1310961.1 dTMP kinase [Candidatus Jingweiarchaeum tengchongense]